VDDLAYQRVVSAFGVKKSWEALDKLADMIKEITNLYDAIFMVTQLSYHEHALGNIPAARKSTTCYRYLHLQLQLEIEFKRWLPITGLSQNGLNELNSQNWNNIIKFPSSIDFANILYLFFVHKKDIIKNVCPFTDNTFFRFLADCYFVLTLLWIFSATGREIKCMEAAVFLAIYVAYIGYIFIQ